MDCLSGAAAVAGVGFGNAAASAAAATVVAAYGPDLGPLFAMTLGCPLQRSNEAGDCNSSADQACNAEVYECTRACT